MRNEMHSMAVVTGASTCIGFELAKQCDENGLDLLIATGEGGVIYGMKNKAQVAVSRVPPSEWMADKHRDVAAPGTADHANAENRK